MITWKQAQRRHPHDPDDPNHTFFFHIDDKRVIDGGTGGSAKWINHACDPNCEADEDDDAGRVFIKALRDIEPGEELNYDYGLVLEGRQTKKAKKQFACHCGSREVPRHDARAEGEVSTGGPAAVEIERVAETGSTNADLLAWARAAHRERRARAARPRRRAADRRPRPPRAAPGKRRRAHRSPSRWPGRSPPASTSPGLSLAVGVALAEALDPRPAPRCASA